MGTEMYYAGIGSRRTPPDILVMMTEIAEKMESEGWILRSGHAPGADQAFERGAGASAEIFLPWPYFENKAPFLGTVFPKPSREAFDVAAAYHPNWRNLSFGARKLMARDSHQIRGPEIGISKPVECVICWMDGGGGTSQAIRIAKDLDIPVTNLFVDKDREEVAAWLEEPW